MTPGATLVQRLQEGAEMPFPIDADGRRGLDG